DDHRPTIRSPVEWFEYCPGPVRNVRDPGISNAHRLTLARCRHRLVRRQLLTLLTLTALPISLGILAGLLLRLRCGFVGFCLALFFAQRAGARLLSFAVLALVLGLDLGLALLGNGRVGVGLDFGLTDFPAVRQARHRLIDRQILDCYGLAFTSCALARSLFVANQPALHVFGRAILTSCFRPRHSPWVQPLRSHRPICRRTQAVSPRRARVYQLQRPKRLLRSRTPQYSQHPIRCRSRHRRPALSRYGWSATRLL